MNVRPFLKRLVSAIFPSLCVNCRRRIEDGALCDNCKKSIETRNGFLCPKCGRRLPAQAGLLETANACHEKARFVLAAAASYENPPVRELIHALKYQGIKTTLEPLTKIIDEYVEKTFGNSELSAGGGEIRNFVIIPVPLHRAKERKRGFNQAALIAKILGKNLGIQIQENNLSRKRKTDSQTKTKNYKEREKNVAGCFRVGNPGLVGGKNIILVDDVFTSGATMKEAVRVLKSAGAKKIIGFVVAKA